VSAAISHLTGLKLGLICTVSVLVIGSACGYAPIAQGPSSQTASPARTESPSPNTSLPPTGSSWPIYTDPDYGFSITYPPTFKFVRQNGEPSVGQMMLYRAVDPIYLNGYPKGQIDAGIYARDADTLPEWVQKHSGPPKRYWTVTTNQHAATVHGRVAFAFDWTPGAGPTIHSTAIFLGKTFVLLLDYWSADAQYESTLQIYFQRMLDELPA
jgi:hypothetical protein